MSAPHLPLPLAPPPAVSCWGLGHWTPTQCCHASASRCRAHAALYCHSKSTGRDFSVSQKEQNQFYLMCLILFLCWALYSKITF